MISTIRNFKLLQYAVFVIYLPTNELGIVESLGMDKRWRWYDDRMVKYSGTDEQFRVATEIEIRSKLGESHAQYALSKGYISADLVTEKLSPNEYIASKNMPGGDKGNVDGIAGMSVIEY